jgi:hypothetical protein
MKAGTPSKVDELRLRVQRARQTVVWHYEAEALERIEKKSASNALIMASQPHHTASLKDSTSAHQSTTTSGSRVMVSPFLNENDLQDESDDNLPLSYLTDPNGAYMETPDYLPTARVMAMSILGLCMGAALMLILSSFMGRSSSEARLMSPQVAQTIAASQTTPSPDPSNVSLNNETGTIFPPSPQSSKNDFHVFSMPMKIQKVAHVADEAQTIRRDSKPLTTTLRRIKPQKILRTPEVMAAAAPMTRRSVCVRMCDGYYFPLGNVKDDASLEGQEMMCRAACPGATTKLFTIPSGTESIDQAVSLQGKSYRSIPMAYAYESSLDSTCACRIQRVKLDTPQTSNTPSPSVASPLKKMSLLNDPTLRPGDAIVLDGQAKVFTGQGDKERSLQDFTDFRTTRTLSPSDKDKLDKTVGISRQEALYRQIQNNPRVLREQRKASANHRVSFGRDDQTPDNERVVVRAGTSTGERTTVRIVTPSPFKETEPKDVKRP